jgi:hypothetical protein
MALIGTPFRATLDWVGENRVMANAGHRGLVLFSLRHKIALWNYQFDTSAVREGGGHRVQEIIDEHLVYAASVSSGGQQGLAVGAVELPGPNVDEAAASLDPESLMILKPGTPVRLEVNAGGDTARVQAALEEEIRSNGWQLDPGASITVSAEMKVGKTQQVTYRSMMGGGEQTVTVTPHISRVEVRVGDEVAWQSGTSSGAPPIVHLKEGQSAQSEVSRWNQANPGFFDKVDMPERILDPAKKNGIGTTRVTNRGLIPGPATPPRPPATPGAPGAIPPGMVPRPR